ncbi:MAG: serine hydrolase domain-containing protein, partial [Bacteroidia bacterium]
MIVILIALAWVIHFAWISFPVISGYNAKQMCTCVFISGRDPKDIDTSDLGELPLNIASNKVNYNDSSVISTVWGMATKKAIYRKGIGCTLINDITEQQLRSQSFDIPAPPFQNTDSIEWPYGDKIADTFPLAINKNKLSATVDNAFKEPNPKKKQRTRAVIILYDGQLIAEKYAAGFNKNTKMYGWSMAKSFTAALIGTLVQQGKLNVSQPAPVPEWDDPKDPRHTITLENLLQQTSGLDFHEDYSSGNSNILSRIIRQAVGEKEYAAFPANALFYKIGIYHASLEPD